jgi:undecaprenyl-diphosphatase
MELSILAWLAAHRGPWLDSVMLALTEIGRGGVVWAVAAAVRGFVHRRLAMAACQVVIAITIAWVIPEAVLKPLTGRPRPFLVSAAIPVVHHEHPKSSSFPSGHASTAVAGAYALTAMWPVARPCCWALAALIIVSRAYLGVHYPTDLVAGGLLGWLIAWLVVGGTKWRGTVRSSEFRVRS